MSFLVKDSAGKKTAVTGKNKKSNESNGRGLSYHNNDDIGRKSEKGLVITETISTRGEGINENKLIRKVPKLPKSLFPFKRKSRKRESAGANGQTETFKTQAVEDEKKSSDLKHNKKEIEFAVVEVNDIKAESESSQSQDYIEGSGFKTLKVPSKPVQRNIHADYASRVARVRKTSKDHQDISSTSSTEYQKPRDREKLKVTEEVEVLLRNGLQARINGLRNSTDLSLSSENTMIQSRRKFEATVTNDGLSRQSSLLERARNVGVFTTPMVAPLHGECCHHQKHSNEEPVQTNERFCALQSVTSDNVIRRQDDTPAVDIEHLMRDRHSLDLGRFARSSFSDTIAFLASLPGPETNIDGSASNVGNIIAPNSSVLAGSLSSVAESSLSSRCSLLSEKEIAVDPSKVKVQRSSDTEKKEDSFLIKEPRSSLLVRRSQSVCRDAAFAKLTIPITNRRSSSPTVGNNLFKTVEIHPEAITQKPPISSRRNHSLKNLSSYRRPSKPTTPKPRKMSSSSSTSSLNMFNFQMSMQNLTPGLDSQATSSSRFDCCQETCLEAGADLRSRASVKNTQTCRRMSLQLCRSASTSEAAEADTLHFQDLKGRKRHSIAGLDSEKVKTAVTRWTIATSSGKANSLKNARRRVRPLSEVQNLRWDVQAIPEHKEISDCSSTEEKILKADNTVSKATSSRSSCIATQSHEGTVEEHLKPLLLHWVVKESSGFDTLETCLSEEDISILCDEEFSVHSKITRSLSIIGGVNSLPLSLSRFYPSKYCSEHLNLGYSSSSHVTQSLWSIGQKLKHENQKNFTSGISNESGYGTMTRQAAVLRPRNGSTDDVFTHSYSTRFSNGDFPNENGLYVEALWDHVTMDDDELGFKVGDVIRVIDMSSADWWWGELDSHEGWFPATFVRILVNQYRDESEVGVVISPRHHDDVLSTSSHEYSRVTNFGDDLCQCTERSSTSSVHCAKCGRPFNGVDLSSADRDAIKSANQKPSSVSNATNKRQNATNRDHIRKNVINEIVNSEKVFASHLKDVIEGYLTRCRKRTDMFTEQQISTLFGNIEEIYEFQRNFALKLEASVHKSSIHETELGNIFLNHASGFAIYSEYCNNHPQALALLSQVLVVKKYVHFFEACRLLQRMIDIPLDGFLLTPVQKICKYPLQLAELLKYTPAEHPDYQPVKTALDAMKDVAKMINERKRMMENITKISIWQSSILNWQGEDVLVESNELVYSGELHALSHSKNKPKPRMAFLFDNQIIICKKDLLRKDLLYYKSRISLQHCEIATIEGSSPRSSTYMSGDWSSSGSAATQCGWKITDKTTGESSVLICKCEEVFQKWTKAFSEERQIDFSNRDKEVKEKLIEDLLKTSLTAPRKPKEFGYIRAPQSFRYRNKLAQESHQSSKQKTVNSPTEKNFVSFFSSVAGKLTPFRRVQTRETNVVF